jgi:hypothetical protein
MWKEYLMSAPAKDLRIAILPEQWYVRWEASIALPE